LDIRSGTPFWAYKTGGSVESSPAVANGVVYVTSDDFFLYALHARTGALLWSQSAGYYGNPPTVASGVVYAGSTYDSRINAYGLNK
jgi:outer membrane protein assembly factor BamB